MNILITGGTGYLGNGLVEALQYADRVCVYSRDEHKQALMRSKFPGDNMRWMIGDVRDLQRLRWACRGVDVVIHAAALKRIEVGAYAPSEMVRTNIEGTMNVIDAAAYCGVEKVVYISSDKAYQPVSPYGLSKAMAECLILAGNVERIGPMYSVVRYGNVSGSTGSVIPAWRELLKTSDAVPVTDPECTRFWMDRKEAVDLVLTTVDTMHGGEINVPDLPAYRIGDLAEAMGAKTRVTGLPEWEKMHESMDRSHCSESARRMSVDELRTRLEHV